MERLTNETLDNAIDVYETTLAVCDNGLLADEDYNPMLDRCTLSFLKELKEYRKMEEQGLILKLPCKVGDTLYDIQEFIGEYDYPEMYVIDASRIEISEDARGRVYCIDCVDYREKHFGTVLFASKEEAEKALAEMEKKDGKIT